MELQHAIARALQHQNAQGSGRRATLPAPVLGWNARDPESAMDPRYAITLDNFFPEAGVIRTRGGSRVFADTEATGGVATLAVQTAGAVERLFAVTDSAIYDVSMPDDDDPTMGVTEVTAPTDITSSRWREANLNGRVIMVNGVDEPIRIEPNGAAVAHGFSGADGYTLTPAALTQIVAHHNRLFFAEKDSTKLWYGELRAITGKLSSIDLGLVDASGGNIAAIGSLLLDSGSGVDDMLAVITTRGTVYLYGGTDPGEASGWGLQGVYHIGAPVGDKPLIQLGGDLIVLTVDGYVPLLQFIKGGRSQAQYALSDPISYVVRESVREYADEPGWEAVLHPSASWVLFNTPRRRGAAHQLVMNSQTKAWCRFTGLPALCWAAWRNRVFFGAADGRVFEADVGARDGDTPVRALARTAYSHLGSPYGKRARRLRAHVESPTTEPVSIGLSADYDRTPPPATPAQLSVDGAKWNAVKWNSAKWGSGVARHRDWKKVDAGGVAFSVTIAADLRTGRATYHGAECLYDSTTGAAN